VRLRQSGPHHSCPRTSNRVVVCIVVCVCLLRLSGARAQEALSTQSPVSTSDAHAAAHPPAGLDLGRSSTEPASPPLFARWWFWTTVGVVAAATLAVVVASSRGQAPPATSLGNQEFQP
jgi:hypothetical protein